MITLDGTYGEGGGALLRTALALATFTQQPFTISNIRAGREKPGLKAQHIHALHLLKDFCGATVTNYTEGTTSLIYTPGLIKSGKFAATIDTAGSVSLLLQSVLLPAMFAPKPVTFTLIGGTCGKGQMSVDYLRNVTLPHLRKFGQSLDLQVLNRGYFPKGNGKIEVKVVPKFSVATYLDYSSLLEELSFMVPKISLEKQGTLETVRGIINLSLELAEKQIGERVKKATETHLHSLGVPVRVQVEYGSSASVGGEVVVWATHSHHDEISQTNPVILGADALLEKQKTAEEVGRSVAQQLIQTLNTKAPVDHYLADQLIPFMGLLPGSTITVPKITKHTLTNCYVAEKFLPVAFQCFGNKVIAQHKDL